jgi:hypothetical protein
LSCSYKVRSCTSGAGQSLTKLGPREPSFEMHLRPATHAAAVLAIAVLSEAAPTTVQASYNAGSPSSDVYPPSGSTTTSLASYVMVTDSCNRSCGQLLPLPTGVCCRLPRPNTHWSRAQRYSDSSLVSLQRQQSQLVSSRRPTTPRQRRRVEVRHQQVLGQPLAMVLSTLCRLRIARRKPSSS